MHDKVKEKKKELHQKDVLMNIDRDHQQFYM